MKKMKLFTFAVITAVVGISLVGVTTATSDYIHEQNETISICNPEDSTKCITMKDRNVGATKAGTECSESDSGACGFHFQWGNIYGFAPCLDSDGCSTFPNGEGSGTTRIETASQYGPTTERYSGSTFIKVTYPYDDWADPSNDNLRGGSGDNQENGRGYPLTLEQAENRRGPCNTGYHVPSIGEWNKVLEYWAQENEVDLWDDNGLWYNYYGGTEFLGFQEDFKIPFAGYRNSDAKVYQVGYRAYLWSSSSPTDDGDALHFELVEDTADTRNGGNTRAEGFSVRCFKDSPLSFPPYIESTNSGIQVTVGEIIYSGLSSNIMTVTTNNVVNVQEDKPVAGEVSVSFGENVSAKFSELVKINVPVEDYDQVIIKVKHAGSSGYNFDGLTTNANASCDANGRPTSSQYNGELITVVNGFASIYTCEASDFVALGLGGGSGNNVTGVVVTLTLTAGENTCTINDYNLGTHNVSAQEQYVSASGQDIACRFLKNSGAIVTLSMGNLVDGTKTIGNQYFTGIVTNIGPSLGSIANLAGGSYNLGATRAIYTKGENTIGSWTGSLALEGTIPAGTPSGEYTGAIEIVIQQPTWTE